MKLNKIDVEISDMEGRLLINSLSLYLKCDGCLAYYSNGAQLLDNERHYLELLYHFCTLFDKIEVYTKTLETITKHYAD